LDLTDDMIAHRNDPEGPMYCRQDTHFSPRVAQFIANRIAAVIGDQYWLAAVPKNSYKVKEQQLKLNGDLWAFLGDSALPKEVVTLEVVTDQNNAPVQPWRESPILLMGDSHTLIYSVGEDMQATGAGLPDHLAKVLGFPVDLVGIRGSGATPARVSLLRRRDKLAGKKLIIWCFTVREFTESVGGWAKIPIVTGF
jgi:alginate O-acetyltransferase complex protein AlgJ